MKLVIIIAIQPRYVADILNGLKTLEIRKTFPHIDFDKYESVEVYIYCTKKSNLFKSYIRMGYYTTRSTADDLEYNGKGKVVAKFTLNKVEKICPRNYIDLDGHRTETLTHNQLLELSWLTNAELKDYLKSDIGYAWHIDNLEIFDKPKELADFYKVGTRKKIDDLWFKYKHANPSDHSVDACILAEESRILWDNQIKRAPQSWCYAEAEVNING